MEVIVAAAFFAALLGEWALVTWWERRKHGHGEAHLRPRPRRSKGRRY